MKGAVSRTDWRFLAVEQGQTHREHDFLALMLGVRSPGVTTAVHILEGAGMIKALRGRVRVLDRERLMELTGDTYGLAEAEYERLLAQA